MALNEETISTLTEAITNVYESSLTKPILKRLDSFGYSVVESDAFCIGFSVQKIENNIKNECNISDIPEGLIITAVDMVCAEVLGTLYRTGKLSLEHLDLDGAIASVSAGDTSVSFDSTTTGDGKFTTLLQLLNSGRGEFTCTNSKMVRKVLEMLYDDTCTVTVHKEYTKDNGSTSFKDEVILEDERCRLSFSNTSSTKEGDVAATVSQITELYISPDVDIPPGSKISVTRNGVTTDYARAGVASKYDTHQQIILELWKRWS